MSNVFEAGTGAVRSNDLALERWDLLSGAACSELHTAMNIDFYDLDPRGLVERSVTSLGRFLGHASGEHRVAPLIEGWAQLATAIQLLDAPPEELRTLKGSLETDQYHYPFYAMRRLAKTCCEGATKYAEENWHNGFELKSLANHAIAHMISWTNGRMPLSQFWKDKSGKALVEDELGHAMWGFQAMTHTWLFRKDKCNLLLGQNYSITEELKKYHDEHASRRNAAKKPEKPATDIPGDRYWEDILQKEEETRKRVATKDMITAISEARGGPATLPRMAHA